MELAADIEAVGSVSYAGDRWAVVGPPVSGRVARAYVGIGDRVRKGTVLAEVESAEVGHSLAAYIGAKATSAIAETNLVRESELAARQISSERQREVAARQAASQAARLRGALQHLLAIGLAEQDIRRFELDETRGGRIPLRAPIDGTVISRTVTVGQSIERSTDAFVVGDLSRVWIFLDIYERDLSRVAKGQHVRVRTDAFPGEVFTGRIGYVDPRLDIETHTGRVRVELANPDGRFRLHQHVTARMVADESHPGSPVLAVPQLAIQRSDGADVVTLRTHERSARRIVTLGRSGGGFVEIRSGLVDGDEVAIPPSVPSLNNEPRPIR